jgi:putative transcription factor
MPSGFNPHNTTQDWDTVVLRGKGAHVNAKKKRNGETETRAKFDGSKSSAMRKLDDATEVSKPQRINPKIKETIMKARTAKGLTQKELAQRAQVQPTIVQQYETGKAKADVAVLRKMERILGVKLTGKEYNGINV